MITFRATKRQTDRMTELGQRVGSRSQFLTLAVGMADATMTLAELLANGITEDDPRVILLRQNIVDCIDALTRTPRKRRPADKPILPG